MILACITNKINGPVGWVNIKSIIIYINSVTNCFAVEMICKPSNEGEQFTKSIIKIKFIFLFYFNDCFQKIFSSRQFLLSLITWPQNVGVLKLYLYKPNHSCLSNIFQNLLNNITIYFYEDAAETLCSGQEIICQPKHNPI